MATVVISKALKQSYHNFWCCVPGLVLFYGGKKKSWISPCTMVQSPSITGWTGAFKFFAFKISFMFSEETHFAVWLQDVFHNPRNIAFSLHELGASH